MPELLAAALATWALGVFLALLGLPLLARFLMGWGAVALAAFAASSLMHGTEAVSFPFGIADQTLQLRFTPEALWLMGFGAAPAALALWLGSPGQGRAGWALGAALCLLGALGVFGVQDGYFFLIAWGLMSLGGAVMMLSERLGDRHGEAPGQSTLFMLGLLEAGTVALMTALLLLGQHAGGTLSFAAFLQNGPSLSPAAHFWIGVLLLAGFGAKLGLLPFYEWFPGAYATGSGASGSLLSGLVLNAAFFGLSRALVDWLPASGGGLFSLGVLVIVIAVLSSILTALYAFQQDDWRRLLAFSSAENAAVAVTTLGACLIFRAAGLGPLAGLAWTVALVHLAGHALAKSTLFLSADGIFRAGGDYQITQRGWLRRAGLVFGIGALFAAMSLAALPPQIGFASEWFTFQTLFQGFQLPDLTGKLTLALAGAGMAVSAAVALATYAKVFGIGLLGAQPLEQSRRIGTAYSAAVLLLGVAMGLAAVGLPWSLTVLDAPGLAHFGAHSPMSAGWLLVPLTDHFAFISPTKLAIVMPLVALLPLALLLNMLRYGVRRAPVWYGGQLQDPQRAATTSLTFANAMRTFYSFIYRPTLNTARQHHAVAYFIRRLEFKHDVADVFGPLIFTPVRRGVRRLARWVRALQSGDLNFYVALIGLLLVLILAFTLGQ